MNKSTPISQKSVQLVKLFIVTACFVGFVFNSLNTFTQFVDKRTSMVTEVKHGLPRKNPHITICNEKAFKKRGPFFKLSDYQENTFELDELLLPAEQNDRNFLVKPLFSGIRGRCYTIYNDTLMLNKTEFIELPLQENVSLIAYIHEPMEDFWCFKKDINVVFSLYINCVNRFRMFWVPKSLPRVFIEPDYHLYEIQVHTTQHIEKKNCQEDWNMTNYIECVKQDFTTYFYDGLENGLLPNCSVPWIMSLMNIHKYDDPNPCTRELYDQRCNGCFEKFLSKALGFSLPRCPKPCNEIRHEIVVEKFDRTSSEIIRSDDKKRLFMYFSTTAITEHTLTDLMTFSTFVSNIGGNLGLFLGFSCLSLLFTGLDYLSRTT